MRAIERCCVGSGLAAPNLTTTIKGIPDSALLSLCLGSSSASRPSESNPSISRPAAVRPCSLALAF